MAIWNLSIVESLDEICAETEFGVMPGELNIFGAICRNETDFKNIGGTRAVLIISEEIFVLALAEIVWSEFSLFLVVAVFVIVEHEFKPEVS